MIPITFTAINAMQYGLVWAVPTVPFVISLLTATAALTITGLLLGIVIRSMFQVLWSGTEYGTWRGLKNLRGKRLSQKQQTEWLSQTATGIAAEIEAVSGIPKYMKGPQILVTKETKKYLEDYIKLGDLPVFYDKNVPPGKMYVLNPKKVLFNGKPLLTSGALITMSLKILKETLFIKPGHPVSISLKETDPITTDIQTYKLCFQHKVDMDVICCLPREHKTDHIFVSAQALHILHENKQTELSLLVRELYLLQEKNWDNKPWPEFLPFLVFAEATKLSWSSQILFTGAPFTPISPTLSSQPKTRTLNPNIIRGTKAEIVLAILREYLEPLHFEGDDTFLRVMEGGEPFTFDVLTEKILEGLGEE